jgi:hypothetical protein
MWLSAIAACGTVSGELVDPAEPPVLPNERACSGADEDGDGLPGRDRRCERKGPDVVLEVPADLTGNCCFRWAGVPDADGDGRADVLLALQYEAVGAHSAWLAPATASGAMDEVAFASFDLPTADLSVPPVAGEFDGSPGIDYWVQRHLFVAPAGELGAGDAVADLLSAPMVTGSADFDQDGIDDLLLRAQYPAGPHGTNPDFPEEAWLAHGPFSGPLAEWQVLDGLAGGAVAPFDVDGDGIPEIALDRGTVLQPAPMDVIRPDGEQLARFDRAVVPTFDVDGDGFDDVVALIDLRRNATAVYAGPFAGQVSLETHPRIAYWPEQVGVIPDLDGDGMAEVILAEVATSVEVFRALAGQVGPFDLADVKFRAPSRVSSVPPGGPFVLDFGDGPEADLALGVNLPDGPWNQEFHLYFEPLY